MLRITCIVISLGVVMLWPGGATVGATPLVLGSVTQVDGLGAITRDGIVLPIELGMDVLSGDHIALLEPSSSTNKIKLDLTNIDIEVILCALKAKQEQEEEEAKYEGTELEINTVKPEADSTDTFIKLVKGLIRAKYEAITPVTRVRVSTGKSSGGVRQTDFLVAAHATGQTDLSVLDGSVEFDNVLYETLPDELFTDASNKSLETLSALAVLSTGAEIGAGNQVIVQAGYYSQVMPGSPGGPSSLAPTTPVAGLAPSCDPCAPVPEPTTLLLLATGLLAVCASRGRAAWASSRPGHRRAK